MTDDDISDYIDDFTPSTSLALRIEKICRYLHSQGMNQAYYSFTSHGDGFEFNRFSAAKPNETIDTYEQSSIFDTAEIAPGQTVNNLNEEIYELFCESCLNKFDDDNISQEIEVNFLSEPAERGQSKWAFTIDYSAETQKSDDQEFEYNAEHYEDNAVHALLVKFMKEQSMDQFHFSFSGGGDSGELHNIECDLDSAIIEKKEIELDDGSKASFMELAYDFCNSEAQSVGNWWDNEGGSGAIFMMANGDVSINVSFYERENELVFKDKALNMPFSIKTGKKLPKPKLDKSLEN